MSHGHCQVGDLTQPLQKVDMHDWVMTLEVAEHIPAVYEAAYLANAHQLNRQGVVLSWATPGQGGLGHVNEQPNAYAVERMVALGYVHDEAASARLREAATLGWFKSTLLVFRRNKKKKN